jgi:asparagine synthase (glutamine-hydrolysing)
MATAQAGVRNPLSGDADRLADQLQELLMRVIGQEMVADVPLGAFLSGGVDSSLIVALMQAQSSRPVQTFTIGFHEASYNEAEHAKAVAKHLGTDHHELYVTAKDALNIVPLLPGMFDEPFADSSQIPTFMVAQMTRQHVTVALSGDGGDESFGGYQRYFLTPRLWQWLAPVPLAARRAAGAMMRAISVDGWDRLAGLAPWEARMRLNGDRIHKLAALMESPDRRAMYHGLNSHWLDPASVVPGALEPLTALTDPGQQQPLSDFTGDMMAMDTVAYLPDDILVKVDRTSMAVSLEVRAPLLHHEVVEFAWRIPAHQRTRAGRGKLPLRRILDRLVPSALIERPKVGFAVPIDQWLRGPLRDWAESLLDERRLRDTGLFDPAPIRRLWAEHQSGSRNRQYLLWDVLMAVAWFDAQEQVSHV